MGTGRKLHPELLQVADIKDTHTCPLAKAVRKALREEGIEEDVKVVFSTEEARKATVETEDGSTAPASAIFVPAAAGILIAAEVFREMAYLD